MTIDAFELLDNGELLQVGDMVEKETFIQTRKFLITRVTKTLAKSLRDSDGFEHTFRRVVSSNMGYPGQQWTSAQYRAYRMVVQE